MFLVQVQLPTYNWTKNQLVTQGILPADSILTYLASSSVSGACVVRIFLILHEREITRFAYSSSWCNQPTLCVISNEFLHRLCCCVYSLHFRKALTRVYNQPTQRLPNGRIVGTLYRNPIDCLWKTFKAEGPFAWYKGVLFCMLHSICCSLPALFQAPQHISCVSRHIRECLPGFV